MPLSKADSIVKCRHQRAWWHRSNAPIILCFRDKKYLSKMTEQTQYSFPEVSCVQDLYQRRLTMTLLIPNDKAANLSKEDAGNMESLNLGNLFWPQPHKPRFFQCSTRKPQRKCNEATFVKNGGGKDFDDEISLLTNKQTHKIDYL
jgi:hypothetical protein